MRDSTAYPEAMGTPADEQARRLSQNATKKASQLQRKEQEALCMPLAIPATTCYSAAVSSRRASHETLH
ncbi:MAG: hypothetical protein NTNFB02_00780 [Nitrospira sp.]